MILKVFTDGASKGNPGKAAIGILINDENDSELIAYKEYIGKATNNVAEYKAFLKSLELIKTFNGSVDKVEFFADSELMVKQLNGQYKVKDAKLNVLYNETRNLLSHLNITHTISYIPRTENKIADKLANEAIKDVNSQS